jgi:hypothetical protein
LKKASLGRELIRRRQPQKVFAVRLKHGDGLVLLFRAKKLAIYAWEHQHAETGCTCPLLGVKRMCSTSSDCGGIGDHLLATSTQGEYTKSKSAFEKDKDFNGSKRQSQILPLRPLPSRKSGMSGHSFGHSFAMF